MDAEDNPAEPNPSLPPRGKPKRIPWQEIEAEYLTGLANRSELSRKYGVTLSGLFRRFRNEKLDQRRAEYTEALRREIVQRLAGPVAERIVRQLE